MTHSPLPAAAGFWHPRVHQGHAALLYQGGAHASGCIKVHVTGILCSRTGQKEATLTAELFGRCFILEPALLS